MMDFNKLMSDAPGLLGELQSLGLNEDQAGRLGEALSGQLLGSGSGLGALLQGLDADALLEKVDLGALAGKLGIDPGVVEAAVRKIVPHLGTLTSGGGGIGNLAGKLFGRD